MELLKIKVRYLNCLLDTGWLHLSCGVTLFSGDIDVVGQLFKAIASINPASDHVQPFFSYPQVVSRGMHKKKIYPEKHTAAYAIFAGDNDLAHLLTEIDPLFYELDRIEIGRRLDGSRWLSFVEMSQSARFSDIEAFVLQISRVLIIKGIKLKELPVCKGTDRLRGTLALEVDKWLQAAREHLVLSNELQDCDQCLHLLHHWQRFVQATKYTYTTVPIFLCFSCEGVRGRGAQYFLETSGKWMIDLLLAKMPEAEFLEKYDLLCQDIRKAIGFNDNSQNVLIWENGRFNVQIVPEAEVRIAILATLVVLATMLSGRAPVLLLNGYEEGLDQDGHDTVWQYIQAMSQVSQVLYAPPALVSRKYDAFDIRYQVVSGSGQDEKNSVKIEDQKGMEKI